jgi:hypothetical protein
MLFIEYQQARLDAAAEEIVMSSQGNTSSASNLFHNLSFKTERAQLFQYWFDRYCEHAFLNCMNSYNKMTMEIGGVLMRPCLMDLVLVGWNKLKEMNVKKIRMVADERMQHKRTTTNYIMDRVKSMKHDLMSASIPDEQENVEESEWVSYMQELRLDYYN